MAFEPQNDLERSLVHAAHDPAARPRFYRDFAAADVFIIKHGDVPAGHGERTAEAGETLQIATMQRDGRTYIPIFSSLPRLQAALREPAGYVALNARTLLEMTRGAELVLNPGSDYGKELTIDEIASILDGSIGMPEPWTAEQPTQVLIGQPANYPAELAAALERLFRTRREVTRAWLAHFHNPARDERPHTLLALEATGDWESIAADVGVVVGGASVPDPPVDVVRVTGAGGLDDYFLNQKPFYAAGAVG